MWIGSKHSFLILYTFYDILSSFQNLHLCFFCSPFWWFPSPGLATCLCQSWGLRLGLWVGGSGGRGEILAFQKQRFCKEPFRRWQSQEFQVSSYSGSHVMPWWNCLLTNVTILVNLFRLGAITIIIRKRLLPLQTNHLQTKFIDMPNDKLALPTRRLTEINDCVYLLTELIAQDLSSYPKGLTFLIWLRLSQLLQISWICLSNVSTQTYGE